MTTEDRRAAIQKALEIAQAEMSEKALAARDEDNPAGQALDDLWRDIILARNPNYGDWEYPGQAYRHLLAEFSDLKARAEAAESQLSALSTERDALKEENVALAESREHWIRCRNDVADAYGAHSRQLQQQLSALSRVQEGLREALEEIAVSLTLPYARDVAKDALKLLSPAPGSQAEQG